MMVSYEYLVREFGKDDVLVLGEDLSEYLDNQYGGVRSKIMIEDLNFIGRYRSKSVNIIRRVIVTEGK